MTDLYIFAIAAFCGPILIAAVAFAAAYWPRRRQQ